MSLYQFEDNVDEVRQRTTPNETLHDGYNSVYHTVNVVELSTLSLTVYPFLNILYFC